MVQAAILLASIYLTYVLDREELPSRHMLLSLVVLVIPLRLALLAWYHLMRGWWRYTGLAETLDIGRASVLATLVILAIRFSGLPTPPLHTSFFILELMVSAFLLASARIAARLLFFSTSVATPRQRIALLGAGWGAERLISELHRPSNGYTVVVCLDDDRRKKGIRIDGIRVEGSCELLSKVVAKYRVDEVWIAIPSASPTEMSRLVRLCQEAGVAHKALPAMEDIVEGRLVAQVREVKLEDLLGREPVVHDSAAVDNCMRGRVVMVTGAAGSIGSELCLQLLEHQPAALVCLDQSETGMFYLELKLKKIHSKTAVHYRVADVCNTTRVESILRRHKVEVIFHAAAYKHVPMMERNIEEALDNNVFGLARLLDVAENAFVRSFVMISSDKAVNPTNVMGTSKRIGELIIASRPRRSMDCVAVRFGNVLGSNGSLVPILREQIRTNAAVTITHPEVMRYFMTIPEAVSLVLQAYTIGEHGNVLVLDMGDPIRIIDLARDLIRRAGKKESEVPIHIIGLREGEKLKEELFYGSETISSTNVSRVLRTSSRLLGWNELNLLLENLQVRMQTGDAAQIKANMKAIVPEYHYDSAHIPAPVPRAAQTARKVPLTRIVPLSPNPPALVIVGSTRTDPVISGF